MKLEKLTGHIAMLGANTLWGIMSPVSKMVLAGGVITPIALMDCRVLCAAVLFWTLSLFMKGDRVPWKDRLLLMFAAQFAIVFGQGCFVFGIRLTSPINASIITTSLPILTLILSAFFLKEPVNLRKIIGIAFGATGAFLLVSGGLQHTGSGNIWGDLLIFSAQLSFSIYLISFRKVIERFSPIAIMKWMFTGASLSLLPLTWEKMMAIDWTMLEWRYIAATAYIVVGGTFISYLLITIGQKHLRPTVVSIYNYIQPIAASILALMWGMDTFTLSKSIAVACIFTGVFLVTQNRNRMQAEKELEKLKAEKPPT